MQQSVDITIKYNMDYSTIIADLSTLAFSHLSSTTNIPTHDTFVKPSSQLSYITDEMHLVKDAKALRAALQYIDYCHYYVAANTRNLYEAYRNNGTYIISNKFFDPLPIKYAVGVFGKLDNNSPNKYNKLYETAFSRSQFRYSCRKAAKMIFLYFRIMTKQEENRAILERHDTKYIIGGVHYALYVKEYMKANHNNVAEMIGYIYSLATYYNGFKTVFTRDDRADGVIPSNFVFPFVRSLSKIETFGLVNTYYTNKFFHDVNEYNEQMEKYIADKVEYDQIIQQNIERERNGEELLDVPNEPIKPNEPTLVVPLVKSFEAKCYTFPQFDPVNPLVQKKHVEDVLYYEPHNINEDTDSTNVFVNVVLELQKSNDDNYMDMMRVLDKLETIEKRHIRLDKSPYDEPPAKYFTDVASAADHHKQLVRPEELNGKIIICDYMIKCERMPNSFTYEHNIIELV